MSLMNDIWLVALMIVVAGILTLMIRAATSSIHRELNISDMFTQTSRPFFLATITATVQLKIIAWCIAVVMAIAFIAVVPYADVDGPRLVALPPMGDALLCIIYFIIGFILFGQFLRLRAWALLALASGYFYQSVMTIPHAITFPEGSQVTPWLFFLWRGTAPFFLIAYAALHDQQRFITKYPRLAGWLAISAVVLLSVGSSLAVMRWTPFLPTIVTGLNYNDIFQVVIGPAILLAYVIALAMLWYSNTNMLDVWLLVATFCSSLDITISTIIGTERFDVSYYAGRGFGLAAAGLILGVLLNEMHRVYSSLYAMMEQQQHTSVAQYRSIVDTASDAIIAIDEMGIVQAFNQAATHIFHYNADEVIGQNIAMLMAEPFRSQHDGYLERYRETGERRIIGHGREVEGRTKEGTSITIELAVAEWFADGERRFTGILRDISERKRIERQLMQSQKMEAIGQLTGGMAHDFNNLLGVVIGNLDMLNDRFPGGTPDELNDAIEAAKAGADLVRRLLAFARRQPLLPKTIALSDIIDGLIPLMRRIIGTQIEIVAQYDENLLPVIADPAQLENALLNLIINSRDAMPKGGKLVIECRNYVIDQHSAVEYDIPIGCYSTLIVSDTGTGIPADVLPHVFEPFFTTKPPGAGSGLGLSMVFGYAKQSGGVVRIYSEVGKGTTVRLYLPSVETTALFNGDDDDIIDVSELHGNERILVVEDAPASLTVAQRILVSLGYSVKLAKDAAEAMACIDAGEQFDLLFTDIVMPGEMNGIQLARVVKQRQPTIKILLASGFSQTTADDVETLGASYITKPYRKLNLAKYVRNLLRKGD